MILAGLTIELDAWQTLLAAMAAAGALIAWLTAIFFKLGRIANAVEALPAMAETLIDHEKRIARVEGSFALDDE